MRSLCCEPCRHVIAKVDWRSWFLQLWVAMLFGIGEMFPNVKWPINNEKSSVPWFQCVSGSSCPCCVAGFHYSLGSEHTACTFCPTRGRYTNGQRLIPRLTFKIPLQRELQCLCANLSAFGEMFDYGKKRLYIFLPSFFSVSLSCIVLECLC